MFVAMATQRIKKKNSRDCAFWNRFYLGVINRYEIVAGFSACVSLHLPPLHPACSQHSMYINDATTNKLRRPTVSYLIVEGCDLVGQRAVLVYQKTEAPLLLQQSLPAAICEEQLHVHLTARQCFQALATNTEGALCHQSGKSTKITPARIRKQSATLVERSIISGKQSHLIF